MERVGKTTVDPHSYQLPLVKNMPYVENKNEEPQKVEESETKEGMDSVELSEEGSRPISKEEVLDTLKELAKDYDDVTVYIKEKSDSLDLRQLAAQLGKGKFLIVSSEFMERMGSCADEFERCKSVFTDMLRCISAAGKEMVSAGGFLDESKKNYWFVSSEKTEKKNETIAGTDANSSTGGLFGTTEGGVNPLYMRKVAASSYMTAGHYSKMARAGSKGQVKLVISDVHRNIGDLMMVASLGDDQERLKANKAIKSLKKLLARGSKKLRRLDEEAVLAGRKKRAEKDRQEKKVLKIRLEMKKKRAARKGADYGMVQEGLAADFELPGSKRYRKYDEYERLLASGTLDMSGAAGLPAIGDMGGGGFTAAEVVVSDAGTF